MVLRYAARRLGPIITPQMLPGAEGTSINGPSLIKLPEWVPDPLGAYYLYFAHHKGDYIRLAVADSVTGPWRIHSPGTLSLGACPFLDRHIASPDVHVDAEERRMIMYFHGPSRSEAKQQTFVATSRDGVVFDPIPDPIGRSYARMFRHDGWCYGLIGTGRVELCRSRDGITNFEIGPAIFPKRSEGSASTRHVAVQKVSEDRLLVFFTCKGEKPERVMLGYIDLTSDWSSWEVRGAGELIRPRKAYEGARLPLRRSRQGMANGPQNELRDPGIYEENGRTWLLYAIAGESGIALAELVRPSSFDRAIERSLQLGHSLLRRVTSK